MMKSYGFSPVGVIVVVVGLAVLALISWRLFTAASPNSLVSNQKESSGTTLLINELGIVMDIAEPLKSDLVFHEVVTNGRETVSVSTKTISDKFPGCSANGAAPPLGRLIKISGQYPTEPNIENTGGVLLAQFADSYIAFGGPQALCSENESSEIIEAREGFYGAFATIRQQ